MPYLALKTALETPQNDSSIGSIDKKLRARSSRALLGAEQQLRARSSRYALFGSMPERTWKTKFGRCTRRPPKRMHVDHFRLHRRLRRRSSKLWFFGFEKSGAGPVFFPH